MAKRKKKAKKKTRKKTKKKTTRKKTKKKATKKKKAKRGGSKGQWTKAEENLLKKKFSNNPTASLAKQLKKSVGSVKKKAARMGLKKTKKYMKTLGRG